MKFTEFLKSNKVYLDGGMGTLLQARGLKPGELPERWNVSHPGEIIAIHKAYIDAGTNVIATNTFGANSLKYDDQELDEIVKAAINNARAAIPEGSEDKFVALDIGPSGKLLRPYGDLDFEDAVSLFKKTVALGEKYGADLILIETMNDSYETKAAILAAKEASSLPFIVTNAYGEDGKLMTGASAEAMAFMIESMGAAAVGANCSLGPDKLRPVIERMLEVSGIPVVLKPNAGLPREEMGKTVFDVTPEAFAKDISELMKKGLRVAGGCCGTTPEYIKALVDLTKDIPIKETEKKNITAITSYSHAVTFGDTPILIGERINPTGKKRFKEALMSGDMDYILSEATHEEECGVQVLDVNVGLPGIDEPEMLTRAVTEIQAIVDLPLQIDTASPIAMEKALRRYNGIALLNSVNGKAESMAQIFPLLKKYGGVCIALTLDENGIPETAEGRVAIAKRILKEAKKYGIDKKNIIFDTLVLTVSTGGDAAKTTLAALREIRYGLGCHTSLGISNVSYGLPYRDAVNSTFFALALANGLSAAIINPYSPDMMRTYFTYRALTGLDFMCLEYINKAESFATVVNAKATEIAAESDTAGLKTAIVKGFKDRAAELTKQALKDHTPLDLVEKEIIPALDTVGVGYENKTVYLPQLLMSAEAAKMAFEVIKSAMPKGEATKGKFIIATVEGDIHDIGKNIVRLLLENYGYEVIDLGKDVKSEVILEAAKKHGARIVGLSALMTTTLPSMEKTVRLLKKELPNVKTLVGGAVLTKEYADKIGATAYAKDAMEAIRITEEIMKNEF